MYYWCVAVSNLSSFGRGKKVACLRLPLLFLSSHTPYANKQNINKKFHAHPHLTRSTPPLYFVSVYFYTILLILR